MNYNRFYDRISWNKEFYEAITGITQEVQNNSLQPDLPAGQQEVTYEVAYQRMNNLNYAWTLGAMGIGYALTFSPLAAVGVGAVAFLSSTNLAVGHAKLRTPEEKIEALGCLSHHFKAIHKIEKIEDNPAKNPRILVHMKATAEQIETMESARFLPSTTCAHGANLLLANAGLPHASFPRSLSPTWTASYLAKQPEARVEYLNWTKDQAIIEPRVASVVEGSLVAVALTSLSLAALSNVYNCFE